MQNRYAGDIGDYVKLSILRSLMPGRSLGIGWWLYPDESHNADGKHVRYLQAPERWRRYDADLFDYLGRLVQAGSRNVNALQNDAILPGATYFDEQVPTLGRSHDRRLARQDWLTRLRDEVHHCDLVFLDPDNGFETKNFDPGAAKAGKSLGLDELHSLRAPGRVLVAYHHQTRMPGGHQAELLHWGKRLHSAGFERVSALRASAISVRAFFILDGCDEIHSRGAALSERWGDKLTWHPNLVAED